MSTTRKGDPARMARVAFLEAQVRELLEDAERARASNQPGAAVAARGRAAELRGELDDLRTYTRNRRRKRTPLEEVRDLRARADAGGSFVAARDLMRLELELVSEAERKVEEAERARLAHLGADDTRAMLVATLRRLPRDELDRIIASAVATVH